MRKSWHIWIANWNSKPRITSLCDQTDIYLNQTTNSTILEPCRSSWNFQLKQQWTINQRWNKNDRPRKTTNSEEPQNLKWISFHTESAKTTSHHELVYGPDNNPLKSSTAKESKLKKNDDLKAALESKHQPTNIDLEPTVPTPIMNKIIQAIILHVRVEIILSPSFLASLRISMHAASQDHVDAINAHLELFLTPESSNTSLPSKKPNWNRMRIRPQPKPTQSDKWRCS